MEIMFGIIGIIFAGLIWLKIVFMRGEQTRRDAAREELQSKCPHTQGWQRLNSQFYGANNGKLSCNLCGAIRN